MVFRPVGLLMLANGVFWLALIVGSGFLLYAALRHLSVAAPGAPGAGEDALAIASARYARGEISRDDYLQIRQDLQGRPEGERR